MVQWFRWTLPLGALEMHLPVSGQVSAWVDGAEVPVVGGAVTLARSDASRREVRLRVEPEPGRSEGGVFGGPVTYRMGLGPVQLGDWAEQGLGAYSGGVRYQTTFVLDAGTTGQITLDLGEVRGTAEVWAGGQPVGTRVWSPYRYDLTSALTSGVNTVEVLVCNTLAPYLNAVSSTNYVFSGQLWSGLFGPVTVRRG